MMTNTVEAIQINQEKPEKEWTKRKSKVEEAQIQREIVMEEVRSKYKAEAK